MKRIILSLFSVFSLSGSAMAAIQGQHVDYKAGETTLKGYIVYDDKFTGQRPGVLVVHEWWGNNDYSRRRADMLAELGYVAFAIDMYGDGKQANDPKEAGGLSGAIKNNPGLAQERFSAALDYLKNFKFTDANRTGAIGYCFGGSVVLTMALSGLDLKGVVSFHGSLPEPPASLKPGDVKAKILICQGGDDQFVTSEQTEKLKQALENAKADYKFIIYDGAKHAFTNPDADKFAAQFKIPIAYNAAADEKSWQDMRNFFKGTFGQ
jgi:dienelactone hydrolase